MKTLMLNKRWYSVREFKTVKGTNKFLVKNPEWGVLDVRNKSIYVARLNDKGTNVKLVY